MALQSLQKWTKTPRDLYLLYNICWFSTDYFIHNLMEIGYNPVGDLSPLLATHKAMGRIRSNLLVELSALQGVDIPYPHGNCRTYPTGYLQFETLSHPAASRGLSHSVLPEP